MAAIAFCPPSFVRPAWLAVQQEAPQIPQVDSLVEYFDSTWMNGQFQFQQWNYMYFDFDDPCTNNYVEGWHSLLNEVVGKPHPNIFELIEVMKKEAQQRWKCSCVRLELVGLHKEGSETEGEGFRLFSRDSMMEQLVLMSIWKHLGIKLDNIYCATLITCVTLIFLRKTWVDHMGVDFVTSRFRENWLSGNWSSENWSRGTESSN